MYLIFNEPKDEKKVYRVSIAHMEAVICDLCDYNITFILSLFLRRPVTEALFKTVIEKYDLYKKEEIIIREESFFKINNNYKSNMDKTAAYNIETMYENITFQGV